MSDEQNMWRHHRCFENQTPTKEWGMRGNKLCRYFRQNNGFKIRENY